ncbi:MAG TPA: PTS sugar transporter subunit IIA [Candidatus Limosilactobacillus merdipullorum]|uniref:PTS sugar transporter subunit IIA n=1 Tax=Candidatus Limosilactobacillus merdipullorum TaxID=2838653 RepID=A0A9D1QP56_9LACO|nr:PTS sugar transporter subunit IIA [Candidatus Limosilactobacillus merdipullorum]
MKILIATHGKLASGLQSSINILTGKGDAVKVIDAYLDDSDYTPKIDAFIDSVVDDEQAVIFTDLYGGSVNQKVVTRLLPKGKGNIFLIANSNLAIILSILLLPEGTKLSDDKIKELIDKSTIKPVQWNTQANDDNDDDFFD